MALPLIDIPQFGVQPHMHRAFKRIAKARGVAMSTLGREVIACSRKEFAKTFCDWNQEQIKNAKLDDIPRATKYRGRELFTSAP